MEQLVEYSASAPTTCAAPVHIHPAILSLQKEMVANRRWFHAHPELSFQEVHTAAKVAELLRSYGFTEVWEKVGRTGVVALIRGGKPGPCIALRADMDGLPIVETADIPYKSENVGVMHACGHDAHMSGLLAAAKVLHAQRDSLAGVVKLLFQPAEEGFGGAREMIADGCLNDGPFGPAVDQVYGLHVWSHHEVGVVACSHGPVMAASDRFDIDVRGKGGHGAAPHKTVDAIVEAAHLVTALQTVVSRSLDPLESSVLTIGTMTGGHGYNIIADKVTLTGTCRSFDPATQDTMEQRMHDICCGVAATFGGEIDIKYKRGYPPTVNAYPEAVESLKAAACKIVGPERSNVKMLTMGAEDFSYFLLARKGAFFFVGGALPGELRPHHKSVFDIDEDAMLVGASVFVQLIHDLIGV